MVKWILRGLGLFLVCGWAGAIWYCGVSIEEKLRSLMRGDPSQLIEVAFDPFAEPEVPHLLQDRVWLELESYNRSFFATIARLTLNLRLAPDQDPETFPLLLKFHHGPLIFAGGFAVGSARLQITLDNDKKRSRRPPRWGRDAKPYEGGLVARGLVGFDGALQGAAWLQGIHAQRSPFDVELERMHLNFVADAALEEVVVEGVMEALNVQVAADTLKIQAADMSLRARGIPDRERYDGLMSVNWSDAELHYRGDARRVESMSYLGEYRLLDSELDAEIELLAETITTAEEKARDRQVLFDYSDVVVAFGALPIERLLQAWDQLELWQPPVAALMGGAAARPSRDQTEALLQQVSSNVSAYASLKLGIDDKELLLRANAEFMGEDGVEKLSQLETVGQLFDHLLADFTYHADGDLVELPEVARFIRIGDEMNMIERDEVGPSGSVHVRAGEVRVNGEAMTPEGFLQQYHSQQIWRTPRKAPMPVDP